MFFWTQFAQKRGHYGPRPRWKKNLAEIKKADHQLSESFYFIKISCFEWVMNLFLSLVMFSVKKVLFPPAKTAVLSPCFIFCGLVSLYFDLLYTCSYIQQYVYCNVLCFLGCQVYVMTAYINVEIIFLA